MRLNLYFFDDESSARIAASKMLDAIALRIYPGNPGYPLTGYVLSAWERG